MPPDNSQEHSLVLTEELDRDVREHAASMRVCPRKPWVEAIRCLRPCCFWDGEATLDAPPARKRYWVPLSFLLSRLLNGVGPLLVLVTVSTSLALVGARVLVPHGGLLTPPIDGIVRIE